MSENASPAPAPGADAPPAKKGGAGGMLVGVLLSAVLSGGAAFGGARIAGGKAAHAEEKSVSAVKPPGPTLALDPFIANISDSEGKPHAVKITLAVELAREMKEEEFKPFIPRIRDTILSYLRTLTAEKLADPAGLELIRKEPRRDENA